MHRFFSKLQKIHPTLSLTLCLALWLAPVAPLGAQPTPVTTNWELASLPGGGLVALLWLTPAAGYKTYGNDPGQAGLPTRAEVRLTPKGLALPVLYTPGKPAPDLFEKDKTVNIYDGPTPIYIPLPKNAPEGFGLEAKVDLLACSATSCWPLSLDTDFSSRQVPDPPQATGRPWWAAFAKLAGQPGAGPVPEEMVQAVQAAKAVTTRNFTPRPVTPGLEVKGLLKAIPLAFLAGFLLNLMPCVLPVACLKLSGLLAACSAEHDCNRHMVIRRHNLFFSLGVLVYFSILALVLGLAGMAWGQLFQQPGLILGAAVTLFALGLSLFGVFHLPVIDLKIAARPGRSPKAQAFATGLLATLLATPCSGPFLGGVLAWTLLQPVPVVVTVFVSIGLGMASPYVALAARPQLVRFVPRPGAWMVHLEKLAGFLIMATCLYFLSILPGKLVLPTLAALLVTALACHAWGAWTNLSQGAVTRWTIRILAFAAVLAACHWTLSPPPEGARLWRGFEEARFEDLLGNENLFVDFTADWCPTCKALERTVLTPGEMAKLAARYGFKAIRVDLTRENPEALALLRSLGSASIPVAAMFPKGEDASRPVVLRDLYDTRQLEEAVAVAFGQAKKAR
jgi:thiol:disulfide interchange protein DsbD